MDITPCLWFPGTLEEAVDFYVDLFPGSARGGIMRRGNTAITADWTMLGRTFRGINETGQDFAFNEAISMSIDCAGQDEVDHYWDALTSEGGRESQCGWCQDRFGLWWQVVPAQLPALLADPEPARAQAAFAAMMGMRKLVVADMAAAADRA